MARGRIVKPEFWDDAKIAKAGIGPQLLYIGTWNYSDDYGVVKGDPAWLRNQVFPYGTVNSKTFKTWLQALVKLGRLIPFSENGEDYYYIPKFLDHQTINKPSKTRNPKPPKNILDSVVLVPHQCSTGVTPVCDEVKLSEVKLSEVKEYIPHSEIIGHLNQITDKNYKPDSEATQRLICARWKEGYRLDDFIHVNTIKAREWYGTDQETYLRPRTLYGPKFEGYVNQREVPGANLSDKTRKTLLAAQAWLEQRKADDDRERQTQISDDTQPAQPGVLPS